MHSWSENLLKVSVVYGTGCSIHDKFHCVSNMLLYTWLGWVSNMLLYTWFRCVSNMLLNTWFLCVSNMLLYTWFRYVSNMLLYTWFRCVLIMLLYTWFRYVSNMLLYKWFRCVSNMLLYTWFRCVSNMLLYTWFRCVSNMLLYTWVSPSNRVLFQKYTVFAFRIKDCFFLGKDLWTSRSLPSSNTGCSNLLWGKNKYDFLFIWKKKVLAWSLSLGNFLLHPSGKLLIFHFKNCPTSSERPISYWIMLPGLTLKYASVFCMQILILGNYNFLKWLNFFLIF